MRRTMKAAGSALEQLPVTLNLNAEWRDGFKGSMLLSVGMAKRGGMLGCNMYICMCVYIYTYIYMYLHM